jgi:hypothetical protein
MVSVAKAIDCACMFTTSEYTPKDTFNHLYVDRVHPIRSDGTPIRTVPAGCAQACTAACSRKRLSTRFPGLFAAYAAPWLPFRSAAFVQHSTQHAHVRRHQDDGVSSIVRSSGEVGGGEPGRPEDAHHPAGGP